MSADAASGTAVRCALRTELGERTENEDVARIVRPAPHETLCLLADGLGGHGAGQLAATIAVETIIREAGTGEIDRQRLPDAVAAANDAIVAAQRVSHAFAGMRTTIALLHLDASSAFWLHCGDTRLYFIRDGEVASRTLDHTVAQMQAGEPGDVGAFSGSDRHRLLRSLGGSSAEARPRSIREAVPIRRGDPFLLCTDGWWEALDRERLIARACRDPGVWLDELRDEADRAASGGDNASAIGLFVNDVEG